MDVSLPVRGGCLCGGVRYALHAGPLLSYVCHCHTCQTLSGSAFTLTVVIRSADLKVDGRCVVVRRTARSGRAIEDRFCPQCRVPLFARASAAPDYMSVRAGTFDNAAWAAPISQSFVESALPWAVIPGVKIIPWSEFDYTALGREWLAQAPTFTA